MHEILTIQLGHRANHLATHFWNAQESYFTYDSAVAPSPVDHDIHFRPGLGPNGDETFTPRTVIYDLKGGFGGLSKWGGLYDQQLSLEDAKNGYGAKGVWDGKLVLQQDPQIQQSDYQRSLDEGNSNPRHLSSETVRYWSDFNRVFYHPRSIVQINDYELGSSLMPFENWDNGGELFANIDREDDLLDRDLRPWAEECDQMQGIQLWASADDAWGGFASRYAERLRDEFGKIGIWVWGAEEERARGLRVNQLLRSTNAARTFNEMSAQASMYVPISVPTRLPQYVQLDHDSQWQTSALLSTALETMTLPSRLKLGGSKRGFLSDMETALNVNGNQRIAQLQCSVSTPEIESTQTVQARGAGDYRTPSIAGRSMVQEDEAQDTNVGLDFDLSGGESDFSRANGQHVAAHTFGAVECHRGNSIQQKKNEDDMDEDDDIGYARKRARLAGKPMIEKYRTSLPYPILDSFPAIFPTRATNNSIAVQSSLATTSRIVIRVKAMQRIVDRTVALDEREALSNDLGGIVEAYEEGWDGGDDSDDD